MTPQLKTRTDTSDNTSVPKDISNNINNMANTKIKNNSPYDQPTIDPIDNVNKINTSTVQNDFDNLNISHLLLDPSFDELLSSRSQSPQNHMNMRTNADNNGVNTITDKFPNQYLDPTFNTNIPFSLEEEEPTTNLDDLINDITSDNNNSNNIITRNDVFCLNDSFLNLDDGIRRHSDAFLTNNNVLPSNMSTSRASISHQFNIWNGIQTTTASNNSINNSLRKMASLNNSNTSILLHTKSNKQVDTQNNILKPNDNFNSNIINFIDPFNSNNNNSSKINSNGSIRPPLRRAVTSAQSTSNIHKTSSPNNERRYSIRKTPYRSSVPTIDVNILKELSNSATITSSNDGFYNNLDSSLSSSNLVSTTAVSENVSLSNDTSNNVPDLTKFTRDNTYDSSYISLPQRTARSASVANVYSHLKNPTQTLSLRTFSPSPTDYMNMTNNSYLKNIPTISTNQPQQIISPSPMNQYAFPQISHFTTSPDNVVNMNNDPSVGQQVMNLPIQPMIPQSIPMPIGNQLNNIEQSRNPSGLRRKSITILEPNKIKNTATNLKKEKVYQCEYCEKSFKRAEHKKRHVRSIHTQERPYACQQCDKKFSRSDNLQQHIKVHKKHELEEMRRIQMNILRDPSFT